MGEKVFRKMQFGIESAAAHGTAVAADTMLLGEHQPLTKDRAIELVEEDIGVRAAGLRTRAGDTFLVTDTLRLPNLYFQALPALLSCGLKGNITPAEQTPAQADYLWDFNPSMTASNAPDSMTLELGDDTQAYEREYLMFEGFRLSFDIPQGAEAAPVALEGQYFARQNTATTFTPGLSLPTTENIVSKLVRYYRNVSWAAVGTTEKTGALRRADIQIMTGLHPKMMGGANRYFDLHGQGAIGFVANFTFEGAAEADAIWDLQQVTQSALSVVRLEGAGAQIGTGVNHKLTLDLGGYWHDVVPLSAEDKGNNLHSAILSNLYDPTGAKVLRAQVITNVAAI